MQPIHPGDPILVRSFSDEWLERRAVSGVVPGHDFPVVRVCTEAEWQRAQVAGQEPQTVPWPADEVRLRTPAMA
jgi:hypothetical protein